MVPSALAVVCFSGLDSRFLGYRYLPDYCRPRLRSFSLYCVTRLDLSYSLRYRFRVTLLTFNYRHGEIRKTQRETRDDWGEISPTFYWTGKHCQGPIWGEHFGAAKMVRLLLLRRTHSEGSTNSSVS